MIEIRDAQGNLKAYLTPEADGVKDAWIDRRINAESTLTFSLSMISEKWSELTPECRLIADEREFIILRPDAVDVYRDKQNNLWGKVTAVESWKLLDKEFVTVSNDPQEPEAADLEVTIISGGAAAGGYPKGSAGSALSYLLQNSEWVVGTVDVDGIHDLETEKLSLLQNIQKVQEIWGGILIWEYVFSNGVITEKRLHLRDENKFQDYNGFQIRYAKNLKHITRTDNNDIITRLYPFGENDLDISSVNSGVKYIENFQYTSNIYVGLYKNQEITDPQELKEEAEKYLEKVSKPRYTYKTDVIDLRSITGYEHEDFKLGDMADVIDEELGINVRARIVRHRYNIIQPWKCQIDIGEPEERIEAKLADSFDSSEFVKRELQPNPSFENFLKGVLDTYHTIIQGASGNYTLVDGVSTWWETDETGAQTGNIVRITPGGLGISDDGGQSFITAITGQGISASAITTGTLNAGLVNVINLNANNIVTGTLEGIRLKQVTASGATLLDVYKDDYGGVLKVYDIDGQLNVKIGSESGESENRGGTLVLYDDVPSGANHLDYRRVEASNITAYSAGIINLRGSNATIRVQIQGASNLGDFGIIALRDSSQTSKVELRANGTTEGGEILIKDSSGVTKSSLTATSGTINGEVIATQSDIDAAIADHVAQYHST